METLCSQCQKRLTVDDALLDNEVRCPACEYTFQVRPIDTSPPNAERNKYQPREVQEEEEAEEQSSLVDPESLPHQPESPPHQPRSLWFLQVPEGEVYGPVDRITLDAWVGEGRISSDCQLRSESDEQWLLATLVYPILAESGNPFGSHPSSPVASFQLPHRGKLVVGLAILGCVIPFVSLWPAVMGTRDLRLMNAGKMDCTGDVTTRAGQAIGMVASMIWVGAFAVLLLTMLLSMMNKQ